MIAVPDLALSTAAVYGWRDEDAAATLKEFAPRARALSARVQAAQTVDDVAALVHNDLEASVTARRPAVAELRDRLSAEGALAAAMTGSGAAVFGLLRGRGGGEPGAGGAGALPRLVRHRPAAGRARRAPRPG